MVNVSPEVVLGILFLTLSNANIDFSSLEFWWRIYTTKKALPTTRCVELVGKKEFAAAALDPEYKTYVIYVVSLSFTPFIASLSSTLLNVHPLWKPQISGLIADKAFTKIPNKYANFVDVFFSNLTSKPPKHNKINDYSIKLIDRQQPLYKPIYSLGPVELETSKVYIETNLANGFIRSSKSPTGIPILFNWKSDSFFQLCINYWGLNNLIIKNPYPLPLIRESLDRLRKAKRFT